MELVNNGPAPARILADARLLWFEVITAPEPPPKGKKLPKAQAFPRGKIPICRPPAELRLENEFEQHAIILRPGERFLEAFDPMLLCGAGNLMKGLKPGAVIYPSYGYLPPPKKKVYGKKKEDKNALPPPPYILDSVTEPRSIKPVRTIEGTVFVLSDYKPPIPLETEEEPEVEDKKELESSEGKGSDGEVKKPEDKAEKSEDTRENTPPASPPLPPIVDERGPRLTLTASPLVDAANASAVTISVTLKNEGYRPALLHFRGDDVGFFVTKPTGETVACNQSNDLRAPARDFFETMKPGARKSVTLRLQELCPVALFDRPGIYQISAIAHIHQSGDAYRLPALVADIAAVQPTRLRVRTGPQPYQPPPLPRRHKKK